MTEVRVPLAGHPAASGERIRRAAETALREQKHLWMVLGGYRVDPSRVGAVLLDHENLMTLTGPGCFLCEEEYRPAIARTKCPGHPAGRTR